LDNKVCTLKRNLLYSDVLEVVFLTVRTFISSIWYR